MLLKILNSYIITENKKKTLNVDENFQSMHYSEAWFNGIGLIYHQVLAYTEPKF